MKNKNLIVITILATVLISGAFVSLAAADEPTTAPDRSATDPSDNSTVTQGDVLFTIQDNRTAADDSQVPDETQPNLIATQASTPNNTLLIAAIATVLAIVVGGTIGVFFHRKSAAKN